MDNKNNYAILTIGYKSLDNIKKRVEEAYSGFPPDEFILIINFYSEESWKILEYAKNEPRITRFIFSSQNMGFAKAINLAYKISWSKYLIMLSDDCAVHPATYKSLVETLIPDNIGISCVGMGGKPNDIISIPQGFVLGLKSKMIKDCGDYVYDEIASPLGCERELAYRAATKGYITAKANECVYSHIHDISNNPEAIINYLGRQMSPRGFQHFQDYTETELEKKIDEHKKNI